MRSNRSISDGMVLERVIVFEPVDAAQRLQVGGIGIDAEAGRVGDRIGHGAIALQPTGIARDLADLALQGSDVGGGQQVGQEQIAVASHAIGKRRTVGDADRWS